MTSIYKGGFETKKEALDYLAHIHDAPRVSSTVTFAELYDRLIARHQDRVSQSTINCYKAAFKYFAPIHSLYFAQLTTEHLQGCVDACSCGYRTKENMKALCTLLYSFAHEIGVANEDYAQHIYIDRRGGEHSKRAFTLEELETLFKAHSEGVEGIGTVLVLCYTGFRINELLKLKKEDCDIEQRCLVGGSKTKAGMNRVVTISPKIFPIVRERYEHTADGGYLFGTADGKQLSSEKYRNMQRAALEAVGVRALNPHECRHTFATLLKRVEGHKEDKLRLIGHTDEKMLAHYTHASLDDLRAITDLI